ncbi:MAG TPA: gamma-glutamyl-gamma-aminobutyrate hydrolase family protein [Candidatus Acidoferrales bacterium]|nr:gamma-glutamyl-gamma-aminobutyrate hydrolase family protein [Candidatus Acidoferrales bacterium]
MVILENLQSAGKLPRGSGDGRIDIFMRGEKQRPRVGIPYRTRNEELTGMRRKYETYLRPIEAAGGAPIEVSLGLTREELRSMADSIDAVVLPGSPADVNPALYGVARHLKSTEADADRERTDYALLENAIAEGKPVLAICYGIQILNVFLGGTLIQDIPSEVQTKIEHEWQGRQKGKPEPVHTAEFELDSKIAKIAGAFESQVNSSHHQAIREPGRNLRIVGRAPDGIIEAVEWTDDANWVMGVQWHPERMVDDALAKGLFRELIAAARGATIRA